MKKSSIFGSIFKQNKIEIFTERIFSKIFTERIYTKRHCVSSRNIRMEEPSKKLPECRHVECSLD